MADHTLVVHSGRGVDGLRFGMDEEQVRAQLSAYGEVRDATAPGGALKLRTEGSDPSFAVYASFREDGRLFTLEVWRPDDVERIDMTWDGIALFATPADEVLEYLLSQGHETDLSDPYHPLVQSASIGLDREGGEDADEEGFAPFFESILVAPAGYFTGYMSVLL
jgi:hypothetical protein